MDSRDELLGQLTRRLSHLNLPELQSMAALVESETRTEIGKAAAARPDSKEKERKKAAAARPHSKES